MMDRVGDTVLGEGEVPRVVVRQTTLDKIAHKLDRMGDFQPEFVYEQASVREVDPRDAGGRRPDQCRGGRIASSRCATGWTCR